MRNPDPDRAKRPTGAILEGWRPVEYGRSHEGVALRAFLPSGVRTITGMLTATVHGEEALTALLASRLLERVPGGETSWAVVPVVNPDGMLAGIRQNAVGVDLNRNFPAASWRPDDSFSYPPGIDPARRSPENRVNRSSPGSSPGSEPETRALIELVERLRPPLVVDLHTPLRAAPRPPRCSRTGRGTPVWFGESAGRGRAAGVPRGVRRLARRTRSPGGRLRTRTGRIARGMRPASGRAGGSAAGRRSHGRLTLRPRGGRRYSTRVTAARFWVVSAPG